MRKTKIFLLLAVALTAQSCFLNPFGGGGTVAGGILKSRDSGESWTNYYALGDSGNIKSVSSARIRMDLTEKKVLYLASPTNGVFASDNSGENWKKILGNAKIYDLRINPSNNYELFAGGIQGSKARLFKSGDRGESWVEVYSESGTNNYVSSIAFDPKDPKTVYIGLSTGEIIISKNGGQTWDLLSTIGNRVLEIDPSADSGAIYALGMNSGLHKSKDGGRTWIVISKTADGKKLSPSKYHGFLPPSPSSQSAYLATNDGLFRGAAGDASWEKLRLPHNESSNTVTAAALNPKKPREIYAVVAQTLYKSSDGGDTWQIRALPGAVNVRDMVINPDETNLIYMALGAPLQ